MRNFLMFAEVVVAILLILVVVLQSSKSAGMGGAVSGAADSVFGGKARGIDGLLSKCTIVLGIVFAILSLFLGIYLNQY
ncbi:preprotein translocase subunit SecG [Veillonella seminalis]|uniref:Protein-export membrane protein SecG n=2 Tax=Veillonella seminalis TaxID=1502943 RepID=K9DF22_9FIRM|nr:preprotein translocase, SecG subunit [Veillonella seminalis ACS-216-V-Col6b]KAB1479159.1 preprotein translocase subunit SecG [Veillonella seminalis]